VLQQQQQHRLEHAETRRHAAREAGEDREHVHADEQQERQVADSGSSA
jgi:hypothetical protein